MAVQLHLAPYTATNPANAYFSSYPAANLPNVTTALTILYWINLTTVGATPIQSIVGLYNGTNTASTSPTTGIQIGTGQSATAGAIDVWTWGGTILVSTAGTSYTAPTGTWIHVGYTCTAISGTTQTHSIYINGILINTSTNALQVAGVPTQFYVNGYPQTTAGAEAYTETNNTQVDDIAIFNRMLSSNEIFTIYSSLGFRSGEDYDLIAKYKFNELAIGQSAVNATDYTGNGFPCIAYNNGGTLPTYVQSWSNLDARPPLM